MARSVESRLDVSVPLAEGLRSVPIRLPKDLVEYFQGNNITVLLTAVDDETLLMAATLHEIVTRDHSNFVVEIIVYRTAPLEMQFRALRFICDKYMKSVAIPTRQ